MRSAHPEQYAYHTYDIARRNQGRNQAHGPFFVHVPFRLRCWLDACHVITRMFIQGVAYAICVSQRCISLLVSDTAIVTQLACVDEYITGMCI